MLLAAMLTFSLVLGSTGQAAVFAQTGEEVSAEAEEEVVVQTEEEVSVEAEEEVVVQAEEEVIVQAEDEVVAEETDSFMTAPIAELTYAQKENAGALEEEINKLEKFKVDEDYVANEAVFLADTREEAQKIADSYGARLEHFDVGVATLIWDDENVGDAFAEVVDDVDTVIKAREKVESAGFDTFCLASVKETDSLLFEKLKDIDVDNIPDVLVEPNYIYNIFSVDPTSDPLYTGSNPGDTTKQWFHAAVNSQGAWNKADGSGVTVAVIDSGIDTSNNDFVDSTHRDHIEVLYSSKSFSSGEDDNGHGTHCAGIVAALDNSVGGLGMAPNARIISIKASNQYGQFNATDICQAINMAIEKNVDVISMSFGGSSKSGSIEKLLKKATEKGIVCIAAAGNEGTNSLRYPAGYDCTLGVGAIDPYKDGGYVLAKYSNWGRWVDIAVPGTDIYSTIPDSTVTQTYNFKGRITSGCSYGKLDGTSMATPLVAGVAALIKSAHPGYGPEQIKNAILNSAPEKVYTYGYGVVYRGIDAAAAIDASTATPEEPDGPEELNDSDLPDPSITAPYSHKLELGVGDRIDVAQGKSVSLGAVLTPTDKKKIKYECSGADGISVTNAGLVRVDRKAAVGSSAKVTATWGSLSASTTVSVTENKADSFVQKFELKKSHDDVLSTASGEGKNYVELYVEPADPAKYYSYTVSGKNIALFSNRSTTISALGNAKVKLYAAGNGNVTVTAAATDGSGLKSNVKVSCATPVTKVDITYQGVPIREQIHMAPDSKLKLGAKVYGTSASAVSGKVSYTWETTDSSENIVKNGIVTIPKDSSGKNYTIKVTAQSSGDPKSATVSIIVDKKAKIKKLGTYITGRKGKNQYYTTFWYYYYASVGSEVDPEVLIKEIHDYYGVTLAGFYTTPKSGTPDYEEYDTNKGNYVISVTPDKKLTHVKYGDHGITKFTPSKKGMYKLTCTALDGSGASFVIKIKAR